MLVNELDASQREMLFRECRAALDSMPQEQHSLFLARLALLLFEQVGDLERCRSSIAQALEGQSS
jgi:hypothetical protein